MSKLLKRKESYWQLQEAKAKFSELVKRAGHEGPQVIRVRGKEEVIVISVKDYKALTDRKPEFWELMRNSPLVGLELDLERDTSSFRKVEDL